MTSSGCSTVKHESDDVWSNLLKAMVKQSIDDVRSDDAVPFSLPTNGGDPKKKMLTYTSRPWWQGYGVCEMAVSVDTEVKRLLLIRHLEADLPRTAGLLNALLDHKDGDDIMVDNMMKPSVVVLSRPEGING